MHNKQDKHKMIRYFQLLIFVLYLGHGFIPHHHHLNKQGSSFDIHFCQDAEVCTCNDYNLHQGIEFNSDCLFCDQLQKELNNPGFVKEPLLALNILFPEEIIITQPEEVQTSYIFITDFKFSAEAKVQTHGLRAPPALA